MNTEDIPWKDMHLAKLAELLSWNKPKELH
jgi:hypothetical protein